MTKIVIDTNVLVSAALSHSGNPAKITTLISNKSEIQVFYSAEILDEYEKVLAYDKLKIDTEVQAAIVDTLKEFGTLIEPTASAIPLPDETDRVFYDAANECGAILVTGNIKHFPVEPFIMTPSELIQRMGMN